MFEALIMMAMLVVILIILFHAASLTSRKIISRRLVELFEFKLALDRQAEPKKRKTSSIKSRKG